MADHPGVIFKDGPSGRRAALQEEPWPPDPGNPCLAARWATRDPPDRRLAPQPRRSLTTTGPAEVAKWRTAVQAPRMNAIRERLVGTLWGSITRSRPADVSLLYGRTSPASRIEVPCTVRSPACPLLQVSPRAPGWHVARVAAAPRELLDLDIAPGISPRANDQHAGACENTEQYPLADRHVSSSGQPLSGRPLPQMGRTETVSFVIVIPREHETMPPPTACVLA
jgi:hypothetical protein